MKRDSGSILKILYQHKDRLRSKYSIHEIGVFGSCSREESDEKSDLDILVDFEKPVGFFQFLQLEEELEQLTGRKVDLISRKALKPHIGKNILEEVINV